MYYLLLLLNYLNEPPITSVPHSLPIGVKVQIFVVKFFLDFVPSEEGVWLVRICWEILL
jgi:hypothetical protein